MAVYNVDKISDWYNDFISAKNKFNNTYYDDYRSSYIRNCSDSTVNKMRYILNSHYGKIYRIYNNINKVWQRYLEDLKNIDNRLAGGKGSINASPVSSKLSKLPTLNEYKRSLDVRIKSASTVIGVNGNNVFNDMKTSYDLFNEYTGARASTWLSSIFGKLNDSLKDTGAKISGLFKDDSKANSDVNDISNPKLDEGIFNKTTIIDNKGNRMEYSKKVRNEDGSIEYFDENGCKIKKICSDGSVIIYTKPVTPGIEQKNCIIYDSNGSIRYFADDGTFIKKINPDNSIETYDYDENREANKIVRCVRKYNDGSYEILYGNTYVSLNLYEERNADGTYKKYKVSPRGYGCKKVLTEEKTSDGKIITYDYDQYNRDGYVYSIKYPNGIEEIYGDDGDINYIIYPNGDTRYNYFDDVYKIEDSDGNWKVYDKKTGEFLYNE